MALPAGCRVVFDRGTRLLADGRALLGGSPLRLLRLTAEGAATVRSLREGVTMAEVGADRPGSRARLVRRLLASGMVHPRQGAPGPSHRDVAVVVPVRDRVEELPRLLAHVGPVGEVVVVDDGSIDDSRSVAEQAGARVVRRARSGGPAAARNTGLSAVQAPFVAFLDSDCEPAPGWLDRLLVHFEDPAVVAVAPRIVEPLGAHDAILARYEAVRSPLDLGAREGPVFPRSRVSYVPAAALVVRREAALAIGGFDEALTTGEDVDFVWRLAKGGVTVRYEPGSRVAHHHRTRLMAMLARRAAYGRSAAALERRHPGNVPALEISPWSLGAWTLLAAGHPVIGAGVAVGSAAVLSHRAADIDVDEPISRLGYEMARVGVLGHRDAGRLIASTITRTWLPVFVLASLFSRRARAVLLAAVLVPGLVEWARRRPRLDPLRYVALRVLDDGAYATGVWQGCLRERTAVPLLPRLTGGKSR
ncbi:MAG: mycofactocin biosynthesis glycosyltransferase MftF [Actinobacteria bacterium]|nr:mycofactocin biosynthesis glycosyltransferase MftF [Actinomycetota bacterium]